MEFFGDVSATWLGMDRAERWSIIMAIYGASVALFIWISKDFVGPKFVAWLKRKRRSLLVIALIVTYSIVFWRFALPILSIQGEQPAPPPIVVVVPPPAVAAPAPIPPVPAPTAAPPEPPQARSLSSPDSEQKVAARYCTVSDPTGSPMNVRATPRGEVLGILRNGQRVTISRTTEFNNRTWTFAMSEDGTLKGWVVLNYLRCDN